MSIALFISVTLAAQTPAELEFHNKQRMAGAAASSIADALKQRQALDAAVAGKHVADSQTKVGFSTPAPPPRWTPLGSLGIGGVAGLNIPDSLNRGSFAQAGRVTAIAADTRNPGYFYLAAAGGGIWRSIDFGDSWQSIGDTMLSMSSGTLVFDERVGAQGALYYGTGDFVSGTYGVGILRSLDGGITWQELSTQFEHGQGQTLKITPHPTDPQTLFIARDSGIWRSQDGGGSWTRLLSGFASDVVVDSNAPNLVFAALGDIGGAKTNGVYRSLDYGNTWTLLTALPSGVLAGRISLAKSAASPQAVMALVANASDYSLNGLYRSDDFGATWRTITNISPLFFYSGRYGFNRGWYEQVLVMDPKNANIVYVGGEDLFRSRDGGLTWQPLSTDGSGRLLHEGVLALTIQPGATDSLMVGTEGGVFRTPNGGGIWFNLNRALQIAQVNSVAISRGGSTILAASEVTGMMTLSGEFTNWSQLVDGNAGTVFFDAASNGIYGNQIKVEPLRSSDNGASFVSIANGISLNDASFYYPPFIPDSAGNPLFGTSPVWRSTNQGLTWTPGSPGLTQNGNYLTALAVAPNGRTYAGSSDGRCWYSVDGASNWQEGSGLPLRWITSVAPDPANSLRAYLGIYGFGSSRVYRTVDGGASWQNISGNLPVAPVNAIAVDPRGPIYVATDVGVFRNADGNSTWTSFNQGLPNTLVTALAADAQSGTLVAGTFGRGAYQISMTAPDAAVPAIKAGGIIDAASGAALVSPGTLASIFGSNLVAGADTAVLTTVSVNGMAAEVEYASAAQINFQMPLNMSVSNATVVVTTPNGSTAAFVTVALVAPGIYAGSAVHQNGTPVNSGNPAHASETIVFAASGLGASPGTVGISATLNGTSSTVSFNAVAAPGVYQLSLTIPAGVTGDVPLVITAGSRTSNPVTISVR